MDFQLTEDQKALRETLRGFLESQCGIERLPELEQSPLLDRGLWSALAEMGVFGLRLPEDQGGVGLGSADAVIVFSELGRRLVPGPIAFTHLASGLIDGAADGETIVGGLDLAGHDAAGPVMVEHLDSLDVLLALRPDGLYRIDPKSVKGEAVATPLDPLTPLHHVEDLPTGDRVADADAAASMRLEGAALVAAQMLGIAETTLEMAIEFSRGREQFGRPIGGFQALKHIMADMFIKQEVARAAVYAAGATLDAPDVAHLEKAIATAKVTAGDAALRNSRSCIQVHGGMGFTWEVPAHYFLKRTWVYSGLFGDEDEHSLRSAELISETA